MESVVLDTNCLLASISRMSKSYIVWQKLRQGAYQLCVNDQIINEYQEIIEQHTSPTIAENIIKAILLLPNVLYVHTYYKFGLIDSDPDDNKFVDCAIAANAIFIVSDDSHFNELKKVNFPKIECIKTSDFVKFLKTIK